MKYGDNVEKYNVDEFNFFWKKIALHFWNDLKLCNRNN